MSNTYGSNRNMDGFPVHVYRKTEAHGWQAMRPKNVQGRRVKVTASPKQGCVVLHRIQVRVRLSSHTSSDPLDEIHDVSGRQRAVDLNDVLIVRRRHCILISSKLRSRLLLFKFKDLKACLQFSDQLVKLNQHQRVQQIPNMDQNYATSRDGGTMAEQSQCNLEGRNNAQHVLSYVARLLCDDRFIKFCNNLESNLLSSEDGLEMLNSLVGHNKDHAPNRTRNN